jgi:hypothetical protein
LSVSERVGGVSVGASNCSFSKTGPSVIYGDKNNTHTAGSDENTAKYAASGRGHAVYYYNGSKYRDKTLESWENISTSDTTTNWNQ